MSWAHGQSCRCCCSGQVSLDQLAGVGCHPPTGDLGDGIFELESILFDFDLNATRQRYPRPVLVAVENHESHRLKENRLTRAGVFYAPGMFEINLVPGTFCSGGHDGLYSLLTTCIPVAAIRIILKVYREKVVQCHATGVRAVIFAEQNLETLKSVWRFVRLHCMRLCAQ